MHEFANWCDMQHMHNSHYLCPSWHGKFQHLKRLLMDMLTMNSCVIMKCRLKSDDYNHFSTMFASPKIL